MRQELEKGLEQKLRYSLRMKTKQIPSVQMCVIRLVHASSGCTKWATAERSGCRGSVGGNKSKDGNFVANKTNS